ncbi:helix-turn-helix domain-containing protein [Lysobacter enzymogenes]|uniref:helix-turn-helix domain-containing protein n=1 Tax=Lysobacter enzymogenes TaxID=69 RepID=UPI001AF0EA46|nr:helix-turn-helix domain-containing protein [Lysobacter enzymogenes]QQQ01010.1 helix-turn-helix domain-containing protein [Lysobacter enzymogenes]
MPNIASVLKSEVARLTRKEVRAQVDPLRQQVAAQRKSIAALKLDIAKLQKALNAAGRSKTPALPAGASGDGSAGQVRFSAKGLLKLRKRLGLSRAAFAPLLGVSAPAIATWESGASRPRQASIEKLALVRKLGKRQVDQLLAQHAPKAKAAGKVTKRASRKLPPVNEADRKTSARRSAKKAAATSGRKGSLKNQSAKSARAAAAGQ